MDNTNPEYIVQAMGDDLCEIPEESPVSSNSLSPTKQCHQSLLCSNKGSIKSEEFDGFMHALKDQFAKRYRSSTEDDGIIRTNKEATFSRPVWMPYLSKKFRILRKIQSYKVSCYRKRSRKYKEFKHGITGGSKLCKKNEIRSMSENINKGSIIEPLITMNDIKPGNKLNQNY
ncbi:unnamed protein product [Moneuplotes crassus]|uniref:Uncharacterized protein n=1 Tax=Euplotes crassus TaxID=5936 RepID=A0AAD1U2H6_EUPCR|nr:unnamed protein product [Moneuplotes crassus]